MNEKGIEVEAEAVESPAKEITIKAIDLAYAPKVTKVMWEYLTPQFARVGFLQKQTNHPFTKHVRSQLRENYTRIMHITTDKVELSECDYIDIVGQFEISPTSDGQKELANYRMSWVQLYFDIIAYIHGKTKPEILPKMDFRPHMEGPLMGYVRPLTAMDDSDERKQLLLPHLEKLRKVKWNIQYSKEGHISDFVYKIEGSTFKERLESFFIGAWSLMVAIVLKKDGEMVAQLIELEESFSNEDMTIQEKGFVQQIIDKLSFLTFPSLDLINVGVDYRELYPLVSLFVQSAELYPLVNTKMRHMFYGEELVNDFDIRTLIPNLDGIAPNQCIWHFKDGAKEYLLKLNLCIEI